MCPGFESRKLHIFFFFFFFFFDLFFFYVFFLGHYYYSANLQIQHYCVYSVSYFITPYDALASSAFSALITLRKGKLNGKILLHVFPFLLGASTVYIVLARKW